MALFGKSTVAGLLLIVWLVSVERMASIMRRTSLFQTPPEPGVSNVSVQQIVAGNDRAPIGVTRISPHFDALSPWLRSLCTCQLSAHARWKHRTGLTYRQDLIALDTHQNLLDAAGPGDLNFGRRGRTEPEVHAFVA